MKTVFELASDAAEASNTLSAYSTRLNELESEQRRVRESMEDCIRIIRSSTLCARDHASITALGKLDRRLQRLRELSNEQELGSFQIECRHCAEAVFKALE